MRDLCVVSIRLRIKFGLTMLGLSGTHLHRGHYMTSSLDPHLCVHPCRPCHYHAASAVVVVAGSWYLKAVSPIAPCLQIAFLLQQHES